MKSELAKTIDSIASGGTCTHSMMCICICVFVKTIDSIAGGGTCTHSLMCICVFVKTIDSIANKNSRRESVHSLPNKGWHFEA